MFNLIGFLLVVIAIALMVITATKLNSRLEEPSFLVKYDEGAFPLEKAHGEEDACFDIRVPEDTEIHYGSGVIKTKIHLAIPEGYVGVVCPRSGISINGVPVNIVSSTHAHNNSRVVGNAKHGYIDPGFRGELGVIYECSFVGYGEEKVVIPAGTKVAQILFLKTACENLYVVEELPESNRGNNGFGSTGTK